MKNSFLIILLFSILFFKGCKKSQSGKDSNGAASDIIYVSKFPNTFTLGNKVKPNVNVVGVSAGGFVIYDSIMILSRTSSKLWSFLSLPNYKKLGSFLNKGRGPFEFIHSPSISNKTTLTREGDQLEAYIYDSKIGRVLKMNVSKSIKTGELHISLYKDSLPHHLFNFIQLDSTTMFCKEMNPRLAQQNRYLIKNGEKEIPPLFAKMNMTSIKGGNGIDINILTSAIKFSENKKLFVEMPVYLNNISIYSLDGSFKKTICLGDKIDTPEEIQNVQHSDRIYCFSDLRLFDDFFGVVYVNEDEKTYQTGRKKFPSIMLFDWGGKPLAELKLKSFITFFDIDSKNGELYTFDLYTEEFYKYNIKDILSLVSH